MIKEIYEHIYSYYSGQRIYELKLTEKVSKIIDSFNKELKKHYFGSVDEEFLFNFTVYQFRYYEDKQTRFGKGRVQLNWILGKKAIERWQNKPKKWLYFNDLFVSRYNIPAIHKKVKNDIKKTTYVNSIERKRFFNTEMGLVHCTQLKLFDRFSKECLICKHKEICNI